MDTGVLTVRYAKALLCYAVEKGVEDDIYTRMGVIAHSCKNHRDLRATLENPLLPKSEKIALLRTAAGVTAEKSVGEELENFFDLLLARRREGFLYPISLMYSTLYRKKKHIGIAKITTAVPMEKAVEENITDKASKILHAKIELEKAVDPAIEGGFIFDINDYRMDASIASQLRRIRQQLIDKNRRIV